MASEVGKNKESFIEQENGVSAHATSTTRDEDNTKSQHIPIELDQVQDPSASNTTSYERLQAAESLSQSQAEPNRRLGRRTQTFMVNGKRVSNPEKGLPKVEDILKLTRVWVREQRRLWPELVGAGLVPVELDATADAMANTFVDSFLAKTPKPFKCSISQAPWASLGTTYVRYSSATQNPRSLDDQLKKILTWAAEQRIFVPWEYVFSDSGITGRVASRTGYQMALAALRFEGEVSPNTFMVEEIDRMSRDSIQILEVGKLINENNKRLVGVTNGFDSNDQQSRLMLHFYAMFNEQYMTQHRDKVLRGRRGAVSRGKITRPLPWGLTKTPLLDCNGREMKHKDGTPQMVAIPHPEHRHTIELIAEMFVDRKMSLHKITKELNLTKAGGRDGWQASTVTHMLDNYSYTGIFIEGMTRHVKCPRTGKTKQTPQPRSTWTVKRVRTAQIWTRRRWKQIQARREETRHLAFHKGQDKPVTHRTDLYPKTLFGGILICKSCGNPLRLAKTEKNNHYLQCRHGKEHRYGCTLKSCKSNHLIEPYLLDYIKQTVLSPEVVERLVKDANRYILELQSKAPEDITPLREGLDELRRKRERLIAFVADSLDPSMEAVRAKLASIETEMGELNRRIQKVQEERDSRITPLTQEGVMSLLDNIDEVLKRDVANANEALRKLLGTVPIHQVILPGRKLATWIAEMKGDLVPLMAHAGRFFKTPDAYNLMKLIGRNWSFRFEAQIVLDTPSQLRKNLTVPVERLISSGLPTHEVALRCGTTPNTVAEIDQMMRWKANPKSRQKRTAEYVKRAEEIDRMVHEGLTITGAARKLGIGNNIAYNAWHYSQKLKNGEDPIDLKAKYLYETHAEEAAQLHESGVSKMQISKRLGISRPCVSKAIKHYQRMAIAGRNGSDDDLKDKLETTTQ